jgi:hypothetical protein
MLMRGPGGGPKKDKDVDTTFLFSGEEKIQQSETSPNPAVFPLGVCLPVCLSPQYRDFFLRPLSAHPFLPEMERESERERRRS